MGIYSRSYVLDLKPTSSTRNENILHLNRRSSSNPRTPKQQNRRAPTPPSCHNSPPHLPKSKHNHPSPLSPAPPNLDHRPSPPLIYLLVFTPKTCIAVVQNAVRSSLASAPIHPTYASHPACVPACNPLLTLAPH